LAINAAFGQLLAATTALARSLTTALELVPLFERLRPIVVAAPEARGDKTEAASEARIFAIWATLFAGQKRRFLTGQRYAAAAPLSGRIEVSHITFRYTEGSRAVLDDVSLRVEPGAFVAFVGPSGGGKSSLLRLLLGFETAETGDILYDGQSMP